MNKLYDLEKMDGAFYLGTLNGSTTELNFIHGYADLDYTIKVDSNSTFRLASLSKSFTAFATIKLCEQYDISLESDFGKIIHAPLLQDISILDLLQHKSGLTNDYLAISDKKIQKFNNDQLISAYKNQYLQKGIGIGADRPFKYQNINYVLLTSLFPLLANSTFEKYLQELLVKYGLTQTATVNNLTSGNQLVSAYESFLGGKHQSIRANRFDQIVGDGGVISNITDLKKWGQIWSKEILSNQIISKTINEVYVSPTLNYQFGWVFEKDSFWHNGSWNGFNTFMLVDHQNSKTLIVLDHSNNPRFNSIIKNTLRFLNIKIAAYGT
ncbi:serine hydrolase domain-containing protein [Roseivirga sp.]|uniref:serine hydrolase domain-containing protein n=1 Tax=Roseivirga sp. TaxID=1964215 RepID=UPI003B517F45